ncbi:hypothetical protein HJG60_007810 [Phyllostomus discolor]|uniref:Uncharacterized protein n=1 Tax=Phyllostomus discolor TaxID=89673 RepID=A0A834EY65_9CHIR|nr:hypothetical protein HJG60_007810 [Phyllostomus discolor]
MCLRNTRGFLDFVQRASVWQRPGGASTQGESWSGVRPRVSAGGCSAVQFNSRPVSRFLTCAGTHVGFFSYLCRLTIHVIVLTDKKETIEHKTQRVRVSGRHSAWTLCAAERWRRGSDLSSAYTDIPLSYTWWSRVCVHKKWCPNVTFFLCSKSR